MRNVLHQPIIQTAIAPMWLINRNILPHSWMFAIEPLGWKAGCALLKTNNHALKFNFVQIAIPGKCGGSLLIMVCSVLNLSEIIFFFFYKFSKYTTDVIIIRRILKFRLWWSKYRVIIQFSWRYIVWYIFVATKSKLFPYIVYKSTHNIS